MKPSSMEVSQKQCYHIYSAGYTLHRYERDRDASRVSQPFDKFLTLMNQPIASRDGHGLSLISNGTDTPTVRHFHSRTAKFSLDTDEIP